MGKASEEVAADRNWKHCGNNIYGCSCYLLANGLLHTHAHDAACALLHDHFVHIDGIVIMDNSCASNQIGFVLLFASNIVMSLMHGSTDGAANFARMIVPLRSSIR